MYFLFRYSLCLIILRLVFETDNVRMLVWLYGDVIWICLGATSAVPLPVNSGGGESQSSRPSSLEFSSSNRSSREMPLSPSGYQQPPTPDFPPPSPATAQAGIRQKIDPIIAHVSVQLLLTVVYQPLQSVYITP